MSKSEGWELPQALRPRQSQFNFDLTAIYRSVVLVHTEASEDGYTAAFLGTERLGSGVVIRSAERKLAYDQVSGFGLVQPLGVFDAPAIERGSTATLAIGDRVLVVGQGGERHSLEAQLIARREFAGYWEYLLEEALFTSPPHPQWGGTALVGSDGLLLGIGSLFVQESTAQEGFDANMFVPIDLLEPVLEDMIELGRPRRTARPWLGLYTAEQSDQVMVAGLTRDGPAHRAGVRLGDIIVEVAGHRVTSLPQFFRTLWNTGAAGVEVTLTLMRAGEPLQALLRSANREDFLKKPLRH